MWTPRLGNGEWVGSRAVFLKGGDTGLLLWKMSSAILRGMGKLREDLCLAFFYLEREGLCHFELFWVRCHSVSSSLPLLCCPSWPSCRISLLAPQTAPKSRSGARIRGQAVPGTAQATRKGGAEWRSVPTRGGPGVITSSPPRQRFLINSKSDRVTFQTVCRSIQVIQKSQRSGDK